MAIGIDTRQVEFFPNVSRAERSLYEAKARAYYAQEYPYMNYTGFRGFEGSDDPVAEAYLTQRSEQDFYFPTHYVEPLKGSESVVDIDGYSNTRFFRPILLQALTTMQAQLSGRLELFEETNIKLINENVH